MRWLWHDLIMLTCELVREEPCPSFTHGSVRRVRFRFGLRCLVRGFPVPFEENALLCPRSGFGRLLAVLPGGVLRIRVFPKSASDMTTPWGGALILIARSRGC